MYRIPIFLIVLMIFFVPDLKAQKEDIRLFNAYYLAKALANKNFTTNKNDDTLRKIIGGALWYGNNDLEATPDIEALQQKVKAYPVLRTRLNLIIDSLYKKVSLLGISNADIRRLGDRSLENTIIDLKERILALGKKLEPARLEDTSLALTNYKEDLRRKSDSLQLAKTLMLSDTIHQEILFMDKIGRLERDSLNLLNKMENAHDYILAQEDLKKQYKNLVDELFKIKLSPTQIAILTKREPDFTGEAAAVETDKAISSYNSSVNNFTSIGGESVAGSFRMPDQSQIIDALAIYLVNRVKQESVLWFFETLQRDMKLYNLVQVAFPNCFELLRSNRIYEVPKMGSLWRYAISKDFALMPENIFKSDWLAKKLGSNKNLTEALIKAWHIAQLIQQKYEYRDIVTTLYTEMPIPSQRGPSNIITLNTMVSLLYCMNEEFFRQGANNQFHRLQYNDLLRMNDTEFEIMLSLIDMKYNYLFRTLLLRDVSEFNIGRTSRLAIIRKWLGTVLLKVDRMDKLRDELKREASSTSEVAKFQYTDYNTWKFLKELLVTLNFNNVPGADPAFFKQWNTTIIKVMAAMSDVQEVFQLLEQKNFAGSVNRLFDIVESLIPNDKVVMAIADFKSKFTSEKIKYFEPVLKNINDAKTQSLYGYSLNSKKDSVLILKESPLNFISTSKDRFAINIIQKLAGFLNDVAYAHDSRDMAKVIAAYAMPAGSYKKKTIKLDLLRP